MLKNCFDTLVKNNKKNLNISYLNPVFVQNNFQNFSIQKTFDQPSPNKQTYISKPLKNIVHEYKDDNHSSCKTCNGSGFIENFLSGIHKLEIDDENNYKNNLEKNKHLSPYKICISCHGTGKKDSDIVFYYTCCQNKNKN